MKETNDKNDKNDTNNEKPKNETKVNNKSMQVDYNTMKQQDDSDRIDRLDRTAMPKRETRKPSSKITIRIRSA